MSLVPKGHPNCGCVCHRMPGVRHFIACCGSWGALVEEHMDKYAVQTDQDKIKMATAGADQDLCPKCERALDTTSNVPRCPNCGTEPFEKKDG